MCVVAPNGEPYMTDFTVSHFRKTISVFPFRKQHIFIPISPLCFMLFFPGHLLLPGISKDAVTARGYWASLNMHRFYCLKSYKR